ERGNNVGQEVFMNTKGKAANSGASNVHAPTQQEQLAKAFDTFSHIAARFLDTNQRYLHELQEKSREAGKHIASSKDMQEAFSVEMSEFLERCKEFQHFSTELTKVYSQAIEESRSACGASLPFMMAPFQPMFLDGAARENGEMPDMGRIARSMFELAGTGMHQMAEMSAEFVKNARALAPRSAP
ncbi:MAG TPA: hypothetical protein VF798_10410, partial [Burkholderiaceae bacterium]